MNFNKFLLSFLRQFFWIPQFFLLNSCCFHLLILIFLMNFWSHLSNSKSSIPQQSFFYRIFDHFVNVSNPSINFMSPFLWNYLGDSQILDNFQPIPYSPLGHTFSNCLPFSKIDTLTPLPPLYTPHLFWILRFKSIFSQDNICVPVDNTFLHSIQQTTSR